MCMLFAFGTKCRLPFCNLIPVFTLFLIFCVFTACSNEENSVSLDKIVWCNNQTVMVFTDDGAPTTPPTSLEGTNTATPGPTTPVVLKDWSTLKAQLGFRVFLPTGLSAGSCLLSASGSVHNPVSDSNFILTYLLPDQTSLTIAQTPQRDKQTPFQCSAMPDIPSASSDSVSGIQAGGKPTAGIQLCAGTHGTTNITFSANWDKQKLQQFFQDLQPDKNWMPRASALAQRNSPFFAAIHKQSSHNEQYPA